MNYSIKWIKEQVDKKVPLEYFFFWGHTQKSISVIDKSCLSQWYPSAFVVDGISYKTAEHWMMAQKATICKDAATCNKIIGAGTPADAKALGREVQNFDASLWNENAFSIVVEGNLQKFRQHPQLAAFLLNTGEQVLVEASPADTIWGIGLAQDHRHAGEPNNWRGTNLLGFALMTVRGALNK